MPLAVEVTLFCPYLSLGVPITDITLCGRFCFYGTLSPFGTVLPRRWPLVSLVDTGPPRTEPQGGVGRSGRESVMAVARFCRNAGSARMGVRCQGSVVWVKCATSAECIQSIVSRILSHGHKLVVRSHYRVSVEMGDKSANNLCDN